MRIRKVARKLGLSALTLIVFLIGGELVARWAEPGPMSLFDTEPYVEDAQLTYVHKPGFAGRWDSTWYGTNSFGWRGPEVELTFGPEEYRIICLGDSCTFGKGVVEASTWPRQLEELLQEALGPERRPVVMNLGVNGYSMWQYQRVLEAHVRQIKPHLVIVGYNVNDYDSAANLADHIVFSGQQIRAAPSQPDDAIPAPGGAAVGKEPSPDIQPEEAPGQEGAGKPSVSSGAPASSSGAAARHAESPSPPASPPSVERLSDPADSGPAGAELAGRGPSMRQRLRAVLPSGLRDDLNRLALYRFLRATYYDWTRERDYERMAQIVRELSAKREVVKEQAFEEESELLARLVETSREHGAQVLIFLFPFESMVYVDDFDRQTEQFVRRLADEAEIGFVDVPEAFRERLAEAGKGRKLFVRGDRYHPNPEGYAVVSRAVLEGLRRLGWLEESHQ